MAVEPGTPGFALRMARLRRGFTQYEVGRRIGACSSTVSRWENGRGTPEDWWRDPLSELLGVSVNEIYRRSSAPQDPS
jgi:DNA-binding XRE family transcriptional regulator